MSPAAAAGASWLASPPPSIAFELTATRVTGVVLAEHGGGRIVSAHASEALPAGAAAPSLNANVLDERALAGAIDAVMQRLGQRTRRAALVLPDSVAKVSLVRFDKVPAKQPDLEQLIRWQVRKAAPFRIEDAQVAWLRSVDLPDGGAEFLVTLARRDIIEAYERACELAGVHAGLVDIASFNQINAVLADEPISGDWLLIAVAADYATLAVIRDGNIVFFRNRATAGESDLADLVHQTAMYHEDRLGGGGFARAVLSGTSVMGMETAERLRRTLEERVGLRVAPIDFRKAADLRDRVTADAELLDTLAPSVGILLRERAPRRSARRAAAEQVA